MALRCIYIIALVLGAALGAPKKSSAGNLEKISRRGGDRLAGLYVKDGETGDLRFLTGSSNIGTTNAINQFITNGQNLLEQLRPNTGTTNLGLGTLNTGGLGTLGTLGTLGSTGSFGTYGSTGTNGVTPIIVNLGNSGSGSSSGLQGIASSTSPIGDFLPQVIAQAVLGNQRRTPVNRRRVPNNRRRPANGQGQIFVIRPNA